MVVSLVCCTPVASVDLLMQSRPFMPYMKNALPMDGVKAGLGALGQEKMVLLPGSGALPEV